MIGYANATVGTQSRSERRSPVQSTTAPKQLDRPAKVKTLIVPVGARYFHPSGFFAAAEAIWFDQSARRRSPIRDPRHASADETGFLLNGAIGYRLPRNRGLLSLEVDNLLDSKFELAEHLVNFCKTIRRDRFAEELERGRSPLPFLSDHSEARGEDR